MPAFVAQIELKFEADSLEACGRRLRELTTLVAPAGFVLRAGRVEPAHDDESGPVAYAPSR